VGFSVIATCGIIALSLTFLATSLFLTSLEVYDSFLSREAEIRSEIAKHAWNVAVSVDNVSLASESEVEVRATNQGSVGIPESEFKHLDVIVVYYLRDGGERMVDYLTYNPLGFRAAWHVDSVLTSGTPGETLNPICPCPAAGKGLWDPGETLVIRGFLTSPANTSMPVHAYVSSPWGIGGYR
jgi:archaellum component FlaF (FlaF/FlaG flagellin family)